MATVTKTFTETAFLSATKSTWTVTISIPDVTITGPTFNYNLYNSGSVKAKYSGTNKGMALANVTLSADYPRESGEWAEFKLEGTNSDKVSWASGVEKALPRRDGNVLDIQTDSLFNENNKNVRTIRKDLSRNYIYLASAKNLDGDNNGFALDTSSAFNNAINITLDVPPSFEVSSDTTGTLYKNISNYEVTVYDSEAFFGGDIVESSLTVGNNTATGQGDGTLSVNLSEAGVFTPVVSVTDSRGQIKTQTLNPITVNPYESPEISFAIARTKASGEPDDEGGYAVATSKFEYTDVVANLTEPLVKVNGEPHSVTWYKTRSSDGTLSDMVDWNDTSSFSSPKFLYGLLGTFHTEESYIISITPRDNYFSGLEISQTLSQAFYTVDFLAGGHGIAFGKAAEYSNLFDVDMPTLFRQSVTAQTWAGFVQMFAGATAPSGWLFCDGSEVAIDDYPLLYAVIGNTYNDGTETSGYFRLPNLTGRFPIGRDNTSYPLGDTGGSADAIVPYHRHSVPAVTNAITGGSHNHEIKYNTVTRGTGSTSTRVGPYSYTNTGYDGVFNKPNDHTHNLPAHNTAYEGESLVGANIPPYLGINFIICTGETS